MLKSSAREEPIPVVVVGRPPQVLAALGIGHIESRLGAGFLDRRCRHQAEAAQSGVRVGLWFHLHLNVTDFVERQRQARDFQHVEPAQAAEPL